MSNGHHQASRGNLFEYAQKPKPSHPDFHGDCTIEGTGYEIRGWRREGRLPLTLAPPRGDKNTFPPDVFRGVLDPAPAKAGRASSKDPAAAPTPAWSGNVVGDEEAYTVRAFEKQGKSGMYFTLTFERIEKPAQAERWDSDVAEE